jgi:DNA mismatch endonuclease Vsr
LRNKSKEEIYRNMSSVRSKGSKLEKQLGSALWAAGIRYRKHYSITGKPDFALPGHKIAIFCDSNFWHGKNWGEARKAEFRKNREFWISKIERNMERDREVNNALKEEGWTVVRFWEDEIKKKTEWCVKQILKKIKMRTTN